MQEVTKDKENDKLKILRTNLQELSDIEDKSIEAVDPSYAEAKRFTKKLEKNLEDAFEEKDKFTDEFIKENDKRENKPMYTPEMKKLKLSESLFEDYITEKKDDMGEKDKPYSMPPKNSKDYPFSKEKLEKFGEEVAKGVSKTAHKDFELKKASFIEDRKLIRVILSLDGKDISAGIILPMRQTIRPDALDGLVKSFIDKFKQKLGISLIKNEDLDEGKAVGEVEELDDDMFTYIYDLFTRGNRYNRPDSPIGKKIKAFDYTSKRDALDSGFEITTNINGNIELRSPNPDDFNQAKEVCDKLNIQCRTVAPKKWDKEKNYTFEIIVPTDENGDPIARKEFFKEEEIEESLNEDFKLITDLSSYEPWSGAVETMDKINEAGMFDELESYLEEIFPDGATITEVNDLLWFDGETVLADLGIEYPEEEDEDEEDEEEDDE